MITLKAMPFDSNEILNEATGETTYDRVAYSQDLADWLSTYFSNGILVKGGEVLTTQLQVEKGEDMNCIVKSGAVVINGRTGWLEDDTAVSVAVGSSNPRIDRIVAELNIPNDRAIYIKILEGTAAEEPTAPELIQTDDVYQIPLAQVRVEAASAVIGTVTDERGNNISQVLIGVAPPLRPTGDSAENISVSDKTALLYNHINAPDDPLTVDEALADIGMQGTASYLAFVGNVNIDMINAAFGMNNEENVNGVGLALAMCAKYYDPTLDIDIDFPNLQQCGSLDAILVNQAALGECYANNDICHLIGLSTYARERFIRKYGNDIVSIPVMTSKTAPSGEIITTLNINQSNGYDALDAFDKVTSTRVCLSYSAFTNNFTYDFGYNIIPKILYFAGYAANNSLAAISHKIKIMGSDDNSTWHELGAFTSKGTGTEERYWMLNNDVPYRYFRLGVDDDYTLYYIYCGELNVFGVAE